MILANHPLIIGRTFVALASSILIVGCSHLPSDGPSSNAVRSEAAGVESTGSYALVDLTFEVNERIKATAPAYLVGLSDAGGGRPLDTIGVGDTVSISVFDPGGAVFSGRANAGTAQPGAQGLPPMAVDRTGTVAVPFAGAVRIAGLTASEAGGAIRAALRGKVANPQVVVSIIDSPSNSVVVMGDVPKPGRVLLTPSSNRVIDVVAASGGSRRPVEDIVVSIRRDQRTYNAPLTVVMSDLSHNARLEPGDIVTLEPHPRRFSSFGAMGRVSLHDMETGDLSLTGALGKVGGLDQNTANASSVLVFRFERPEVARALGLTQPPTPRGVPVVYRLNLASGSGFFVANTFRMQPDDVIYTPRSTAAELRKFFEFVQTVTRVVYDIQATGGVYN